MNQPLEPSADPSATGSTLPEGSSISERLRSRLRRRQRIRLAARREELMTPAHGVVDICDRLAADAGDGGPRQFAVDLQKMQRNGHQLVERLGQTLSASEEGAPALTSEQQKSLRHDLRNYLNVVICGADEWLEEAQEVFLDAFIPDLEILRGLGRQCLESIDRVLTTERDDDPQSQESVLEVSDLLSDRPESAGDRFVGRILIAEDNATNRDLLQRRLVFQGHTVSTAANGREAIDLLRKEAFDLVLLDIVMPEIDGLHVLSEMKSDPELRDIPVIMISAIDESEIVVRCIEMGAVDYLQKPFDKVLLKARIGATIERRRLTEQVKVEKQRADDLLQVILPREIVTELKATNVVKPRRHEDVAVLFADIVNFTPFCENRPPEEVMNYLQQVVMQWEDSAIRLRVEKIKTIGDAFMAASGLMQRVENPVLQCVLCGLEMIASTHRLPVGWNLRVGIHYGQVVAGVLGRRQFLFDLWGDTVNTAARMESHGTPGKVCLSSEAWERISGIATGASVGKVKVKGKGELEIIQFEAFRSPPEKID
jgi:class 3 adenylate cyclase